MDTAFDVGPSTANALDVDKRCRVVLAELQKNFPPGMKGIIAVDTTLVIGESVHEVVTTIGEAIIIVIIVIFLFLQDWRATIIPAVTIPVSLIGTFAFIKIFGFSINSLTLFGITLATGLVVDDAIVVIENVQRHIEAEHCDSHRATSEAMAEVTSAVIAVITLANLLAAARLVVEILTNNKLFANHPGGLLAAGAVIWATNVIAAALGITFFLIVVLVEKLVVRRAPEHYA